MAVWRLALATLGTSGLGTPTVSDVMALGLQHQSEQPLRFSRVLGGPGAISFELAIDGAGVDPSTFVVGGRELHLYRDDGGGEELRWGGRLWKAELKGKFVRFSGEGFFSSLRRRRMADDFFRQADEQLDIAWDAIDYTQGRTGGALGITRASLTPSGVTRTILACGEARVAVADVIDDLAGGDNGFDYEVGADKVWRTWYPARGTDVSASVVFDGATNAVEIERQLDGEQIANSIGAISANLACEPLSYYTAVDATSRTAYGLLEDEVERTDLEDTTLVDALADEELRLRKDPADQIRVTTSDGIASVPNVHAGDFDLGDEVRVKASAGGFGTFDAHYRVLGFVTTLRQTGEERTTYDLDEAIA